MSIEQTIGQTVEKIRMIYSGKPVLGLFVATATGSREIELSTDDLKALADAYEAAIAERDDYRQVVEHYADIANWNHMPLLDLNNDIGRRFYVSDAEKNGYAIAQKALDKHSREAGK